MSARHPSTQSVLPGLLAGGLLVITAALLMWGKFKPPEAAMGGEAVLWQRALLFCDGPQGEVVVKDFNTGEVIGQFAGEQGFVRGTLRALVRERKRRDVGPDQPFELIAKPQGRLILSDPSTQQHIDLDAFGLANATLFRRLQGQPSAATHLSGSSS